MKRSDKITIWRIKTFPGVEKFTTDASQVYAIAKDAIDSAMAKHEMINLSIESYSIMVNDAIEFVLQKQDELAKDEL